MKKYKKRPRRHCPYSSVKRSKIYNIYMNGIKGFQGGTCIGLMYTRSLMEEKPICIDCCADMGLPEYLVIMRNITKLYCARCKNER